MTNPEHEHDWQLWDHAVTRDVVERCTICHATRSHRGTLQPRPLRRRR